MEPERLKEYVDKLLDENIPAGQRVGIFQQIDKVDGNLSEVVTSKLTSSYTLTEMNQFMNLMHKTKI